MKNKNKTTVTPSSQVNLWLSFLGGVYIWSVRIDNSGWLSSGWSDFDEWHMQCGCCPFQVSPWSFCWYFQTTTRPTWGDCWPIVWWSIKWCCVLKVKRSQDNCNRNRERSCALTTRRHGLSFLLCPDIPFLWSFGCHRGLCLFCLPSRWDFLTLTFCVSDDENECNLTLEALGDVMYIKSVKGHILKYLSRYMVNIQGSI